MGIRLPLAIGIDMTHVTIVHQRFMQVMNQLEYMARVPGAALRVIGTRSVVESVLRGLSVTQGMDPKVKVRGAAQVFPFISWVVAMDTALKTTSQWDQIVGLACHDAEECFKRQAQVVAGNNVGGQEEGEGSPNVYPSSPSGFLRRAIVSCMRAVRERAWIASRYGGLHPTTRGRIKSSPADKDRLKDRSGHAVTGSSTFKDVQWVPSPAAQATIAANDELPLTPLTAVEQLVAAAEPGMAAFRIGYHPLSRSPMVIAPVSRSTTEDG